MYEMILKHSNAMLFARTFRRPYCTIKFANNGSFELDQTYFTDNLPTQK